MILTLDASPWGLGGYLVVNGQHIAWFACSLTQDDVDVLDIELGSSTVQQAAEALAMLVALKLWLPYWRTASVSLKVRSDSVSALILLMHLKTSGKATNIIAREVALVLSEGTFMPSVYSHVPGVKNTIADCLSRRFSPDSQFVLPVELLNAREDKPPRRVSAWWKSLYPPASQLVERGL